ncbi:MAG: outer membrane lipoprotein-sorting protein [Halieaceae bacterium]|jgi:outer membrane lipoprotein-sorting protein
MNAFAKCLALTVSSCVLAVSASLADDPTIAWELNDALKQIDRQADNFASAMAHVTIVRTDRSGTEIERLEGVSFANDDGDMRISVSAPESRVYLMDSRDLYVYLPDQQLVQEYYLPKHPERVVPFMRLGFSETGRDLRDDYIVSAIGERFIGDRRTLGLDLTPKSDKERARVNRIQLWIDQASWMPVEQIIEATASGEKTTVLFANMARNLKLNPDLFKRKWPRGTKKTKMK